MMPRRPLVGVVACSRMLENLPFHVAGDKYVAAVAEAAGAIPVVLPALPSQPHAAELVARLDGLLLTGSASHVAPARYGGTAALPAEQLDPKRDASVAALLTAAVAIDLPVLAICRGMQELNVWRGGTLRHGVAGHHPADDAAVDIRYAPAHDIRASDWLAGLLQCGETIKVNSVHEQAIDRLGSDLSIEAEADDGSIEAIRLAPAAFVLGVQWHPEYAWRSQPGSPALFAAFAASMKERAA